MRHYFGVLDYLIFGALLLVSAGIGVYFGYFAKKKQNTTAEYLLGSKSMGVLPVAISLVASYVSGIALLSLPAEMYVYGTQFSLTVVSEVLGCIFMAYVYIPVFFTLQLTSSYDYLRLRFGKTVRTLGTFLFVLKMVFHIPIVIYVPALALNQVSGINLHLMAVVSSIVCIFYTSIGGLKAVVWTDAVQWVMMMASVMILIVIGTGKVGGTGEVISRNMETGRIEFDTWSLDPRERHSVWGVIFGNFFFWLSTFSVNQMMVQRCLSLPTDKKANQAIVLMAFGFVSITLMCCYTGLIIFAYYHKCDPLMTKEAGKADQIVPLYLVEVASSFPGLPGVFISGVFSAALSTMSAGLNSASGVIYQDLIRPLMKRPLSEATSSFIMKMIVSALGVLCVGLVFFVEKVGPLLQAVKSFGGIAGGPLLGLFTLGMFFPWANEKGALVGGLFGLVLTGALSIFSQLAIARGQIRFKTKPFSVEDCEYPLNMTIPELLPQSDEAPWILQVSYLWYPLIGLVIVLTLGMLVSYITGFTDPKDVPRDLLTPVIHRFLPEKKKKENEENGFALS